MIQYILISYTLIMLSAMTYILYRIMNIVGKKDSDYSQEWKGDDTTTSVQYKFSPHSFSDEDRQYVVRTFNDANLPEDCQMNQETGTIEFTHECHLCTHQFGIPIHLDEATKCPNCNNLTNYEDQN